MSLVRMSFYFIASVALLALLLFFPVRKLVWVLSVRRLERKTGSVLDEPERQGQRRRAAVIAVFVVLTFSLLYNLYLFREFARG